MSFKFLELFPGTVEFKGNSIESIESEDLQDLSKDYSVSFWILLNKVMKGRQVTVYHKGDNSNSQPTISLHERSLLVKFDTVRSGSERIFANAEIEVKKWTHVVFTVSQNEYIEAKLYVNGKLDSSISIKNEILHCNSKCYIGKDP